jgi:threonine dehydrogenase-like Zn-dependent dehydrogenase
VRALAIEAHGVVRLREVAVPSRPGECLIKLRMAGICGTDLQLLEGYAEFRGIPGHEFVGRVESVDSRADAVWVDKRVVGEINVGCDRCDWCAIGEKEHCSRRTVVGIRGRDGAFADYVTLPASNLHEVPDSIDDRSAVFVEPLAAACRILEQVDVDEASRVAVLGDGRLGLLAAQVLQTRARDVVLLGRHERKMAVARALGVETRPSGAEDAHGFDIVVEATGSASGIVEAVELVRPRGIVVMKSTVHGEAPVATWPMVVNEVTLVGSRCGPFVTAIGLLASGAVRVESLVTSVLPLESHDQAFAEARRGLKVLFAIE